MVVKVWESTDMTDGEKKKKKMNVGEQVNEMEIEGTVGEKMDGGRGICHY